MFIVSLRPGYLEKVYEQAMAFELNHRGLVYATIGTCCGLLQG